MLNNRDFTLAKYEKLCNAVARSKYKNVTIEEYLGSDDIRHRPCVIMRHDVDENARYALDMAQVEREHGIRATYYFRMKRRTYDLSIIDKIAACGHEIGYHYETMDKCKGDVQKALLLFEKELAIFRERYNVTTACMHGNPLTKHDNKAIWREASFSQFGLLGEPYISVDYSKFAYFSDSGRTWNQSAWKKTKDKVAEQSGPMPQGTDDLIRIVTSGELDNICILMHPERWSKNIVDYCMRYMIDMVYLAGKTVIHWLRNKQ